MVIQDAIRRVTAGIGLSVSEAIDVFSEIMIGKATDAQIAAFIVGRAFFKRKKCIQQYIFSMRKKHHNFRETTLPKILLRVVQ